MSDTTKGLYHKFYVERLDGKSENGKKHYGCEYFALDLTHDKFASAALEAYALACWNEYPVLANDLWERIYPDETLPLVGENATLKEQVVPLDRALVEPLVEALRDAQTRFRLLHKGGVKMTNGANPAVGEQEARKAIQAYDASKVSPDTPQTTWEGMVE